MAAAAAAGLGGIAVGARWLRTRAARRAARRARRSGRRRRRNARERLYGGARALSARRQLPPRGARALREVRSRREDALTPRTGPISADSLSGSGT